MCRTFRRIFKAFPSKFTGARSKLKENIAEQNQTHLATIISAPIGTFSIGNCIYKYLLCTNEYLLVDENTLINGKEISEK